MKCCKVIAVPTIYIGETCNYLKKDMTHTETAEMKVLRSTKHVSDGDWIRINIIMIDLYLFSINTRHEDSNGLTL